MGESEPIASPRGFDIGISVSRQQQAVSDEGSGRGFDPTYIVFTAAVAFFEREARSACSRALRFGAGKRDERAVAVAKLARLRPIDIPARISAERHSNRRQFEARDCVTIPVDRANFSAVIII